MFLLGADPELMLVSNKGELVSAIEIIPEGKGQGRVLNRGAVLHDNVLIEFNIDPSSNEKEFVETNKQVMQQISKLVKGKKLKLLLKASASFPEEALANPEAGVFGCDPDFTAWGEPEMQTVCPEAANKAFRSAGGHLHLGMSENEQVNQILGDDFGYGKIVIVKALDILCGIPSVFLDKDESSPARRSLYGKAGSHRPKPYGLEYRAMSSWWLASPEHTKLVYKLAHFAIQVSCIDKTLDKLVKDIGGEDVIQDVINNSKAKKAKTIYTKHIKPLIDKSTQLLVSKLDKESIPDFYKVWDL